MIFPEVKIYHPDVFEDFRGELFTLFKQEESDLVFNHDKVSISKQYVLRGLHGDSRSWKLITCLAGEVYLVVVDNRPESPNYLKWDWIILDDRTRKQVLTPPQFAIGFLVLSDQAMLHYKWAYEGEYADIDVQFTLKWDDPKINIYWPIDNPILQKRDK